MSLNEKLAYLEGYIDGLDIDDETKEGKAILAILDLLEDIVEETEEMQDDIEDLEQLGDELDEDLGQLEEFILGDLCDCDDDDCDCGCCDDDDEYDFGDMSGWIFCVNGEVSAVGCGEYELQQGDQVEWVYSLAMGTDIY